MTVNISCGLPGAFFCFAPIEAKTLDVQHHIFLNWD